MNIPLAIFLILAVTAIGSVILRGYGKGAAIISTVGALIVAGIVLLFPLNATTNFLGFPLKFEPTWIVLGRRLILTSANRVFIGFLSLSMALLMVNWWIPSGRYFHSIMVLMLGALTGSLLIEPFLFAAIFLEFAAMGAVVLIATGRERSSRGALRILTFYTLSTITILTTGWLLENAAVTSETPELVRRVTILIGVGFAILMVVPPLHSWLPTAAEGTPPIAIILILVLLQSSGLFFLFRFLDSYAWLREDPLLVQGIQVMGAVMVLSGGVLALSARSRVKAFLYAALADFGVSLLAIGTFSDVGYLLALTSMGIRVITLGMWAFAMQLNENGFEKVGTNDPIAILGLSMSWLALCGFPLTPGFAIRWNILRILSDSNPTTAAVVASGSVMILLAFLPLLRTVKVTEVKITKRTGSVQRGRLLVIAGLVVFVIVGMFPQLLSYWSEQAIAGLPNLIP